MYRLLATTALVIGCVLVGGFFWWGGHLPQSGRMDAIFFESESHGFVRRCCPSDFLMYETEDGGKSWHLSNSTQPKLRRGRVFVSPLKGFSVVQDAWPHREIHVSEDGGKIWKLRFRSETKTDFYFDNLQALSETDVLAGCYRTRDGGETWQKVDIPGGFPFFLDRENGWSINDATILRTMNNGARWEKIGKLPDASKGFDGGGDLFFLDLQHGWVVGGRQEGNDEGGALSSAVFYTEDGGATWKTKAIVPGYFFWSVFFLNEKIGWAGGTQGSVLKTIDGGKTWKLLGSAA